MAKNLAPTSPADKHLANELSLKAPSSPMLEPSSVRATGTAPTDKGQQGSKSGAMNSRLARKKSGLLNDPADAFDDIQSSPSQDTVRGADRLETAAATESMGASSPLDAANLEASGAELSAYGAQQASAFGEPLVLAQAVVDAPSAATLSSASANASASASASAAAATAATSIGAGGFMALAGMIVAASRVAATHKAPATQPTETPTTQPTETPTTTSLSLVVQDGYLDGAEVWVDMNDNGVIDALVDFKFGISVNGKVDGALTDAQKLHALITTGGTDISTGLAFQGSYSATAGSTVVNPLTSLVQSMVQSSMGSTAGMTDAQKLARINEVKAAALAAVNSALGLPVGADLTRIDTISTATASTGDAASGISLEQALEINSKALMVANMMAMGAAALKGASTSSGVVPSMSTFSNFIVQGIVAAIIEAAASGETVALGDSDSLTAILTSASTAATTAATATGGSFAMDSTKLSAANAAVATSVASTNSLITTLTGNAITANAINPGSATGALTQMLAAQKAVLSQLDELQNNDVSVLNTFTDVAAVFTASQSAENTAGLKLGTQAVTAPTVVADTVAATVASVTVEAERVGDLAQFVVEMSEGLFVKFSGDAKPTIAIQNTANSTATAVFDPGASTGNKLVFTYRVQAGDTQLGIAAGTMITLPGTSVIKDLGGNNANLSLDSGLAEFTAAEVIGRVAVDTKAPEVSTVTEAIAATVTKDAITFTVTFSEALTGTVGTNNFTATNGTVTSVARVDGTNAYTVVVTPTAGVANGNVALSLVGKGLTDAASNALASVDLSTMASQAIDTKAPTLAITSNKEALKAGETATITFTFSEDPATSFAWNGLAGDIVVTGGTLGAISGSGLTRTATFTPDVNTLGSASITVAAASYFDTTGNSGTAAATPILAIDTRPLLSISSSDLATAIDENTTANTLVYTATSAQQGVTFSLNQAAAALGDARTITQTSAIRVTDTLAEGVTLTRGTTGPMVSNLMEDGITPTIEWNSDGWAHLSNVAGRTYTSFANALNNKVGDYILPAELVIHDRVNDTYYKVDFTQYQGGGNGGAFSYQRSQITLSAENNFDINDQGEVFLTVSPDYETDIAYEFTVVASDGQGNTVQKTVTLPINNLDDTAPVITSGNTARTLVVDSGADQLVYTVTADDSGDISTGSVTYSLASPPQAVLGDAVEISLPSKSIYRGMDYTDVIAEGVGFSRGIVHEGFAVTAEWNTDGWDNLGQVAQRAYDIEMPDNFDALVLHDIFSDRYYKLDFNAQDGGYIRTEISANGTLGNPVAISAETLITTGDAISAGLKLQVVTHANTYTYQSSGSTEALDFVWDQGNVLDSNVSDRVMVHFQGQLTIDDPDGTGLAQALAFQLNHDDSLYIQFANANGQFLGSPLGVSNDTTTVTLTAGQTYLVDVWYQEDGGDANLFVGLPANAQWSGALQYDTFAVELGASGQWAAPWSASNLKAIADDATPGDTFAVISFDSNSLHARPTVEWNDDGWADLSDLKDVQTRVFDAEVNGGTATTTNWVMHDTVNDTYYTVDFSKWSMGGNGRVGGGGGFAYDRQLIDLSGRAPVLGEAEAVYVPDGMNAPVDRLDSGVELTRFWAQPLQGVQTVEWNADGWGDDLTDVATRNYTTNMALAVMPDPDNYDSLGNVVLDREWLMHDLVNDTYYKVQFQGWQHNANGGDFAYTRSQIDTQTGALLNTVEFTKSADTPFDLVDTGVVISRGIQRRSPLNSSGVEWNGDGWYDLEDLEVVASRDFYTTLSDALNDNWTDAEFVMRDLLNGRYYKIDVTDWQEGGGGAVSYVRSEIIQKYDTDLTMGGFAIDPVTGEVRLLGDPLPANSPYHLIVVATDAAGNVSYQDVSMVVQPNYAPTFEMVNPDSVGSGDVVAFANLAEGVAYQAVATDANAGTVFTYGLLDSTDAALFTIDTATGAVRFKQAPDMTQPLDAGEDNIYNLTITASDGVNTPPTELAVSIEVLVPPSIAATASADFTENETGVVFTAEAVASYLTYSLAGADAALFEIDAGTGELRFLNVPDYETPLDAGKNNVYDVSVVANTYNLQASQQVSVSMLSVYEAPVMVGASSAQTAENSNGTVYTARATAEADSTLTFALGGADAALFSINKDSGAVAFLAAPNYEDPLDDDGNNLYELTVTADDGTTASQSQSVVIAVTNVIEPTVVNVTVSADTVTEGDAANLVYTFTRSGDIDRALKVNIGMGGTATAEDYASNAPLAKSWSRLVGGSGADYLYSIAATADGGFYTVGTARYYDSSNPLKSADSLALTPLGEADVFIRKYGSDGTQQWTRLYGGANDDAATSVVVGSDGSAYVAGYGNGPNGSNSTFIVKYSAVGALDNTWELTGLFPSNWVSRSLALAPDEATLFVGGWFFGDGRESYITKVTLSPEGTPGTPETFTLSNRATSAIAAASDGSVYLTGFTEYDIDGQTNAGGADAFVSKLDSAGLVVWSRLIGGKEENFGTSVLVGPDGSVYVAGGSYSSILISKFDSDGLKLWEQSIANGRGAESSNYPCSLAMGSDGWVYLSGVATQDIGDQVALGDNDAFLSQINPDNGAIAWTRIVGSEGSDRAMASAAGPDGEV